MYFNLGGFVGHFFDDFDDYACDNGNGNIVVGVVLLDRNDDSLDQNQRLLLLVSMDGSVNIQSEELN